MFEEVGYIYGEESGWRCRTCMCVCLLVCVWGARVMCSMTQQGVELRLHQAGYNSECQAMWIKTAAL